MNFRTAITLHKKITVTVIASLFATILMAFQNFLPIAIPLLVFATFLASVISIIALSIYISYKYGKIKKYAKFMPKYESNNSYQTVSNNNRAFNAFEDSDCVVTDIKHKNLSINIYNHSVPSSATDN